MNNIKLIGFETKLKENKENHNKRMENIITEINQKMTMFIKKHQITSSEYCALLANMIQDECNHRINESLARTTQLQMSSKINIERQ